MVAPPRAEGVEGAVLAGGAPSTGAGRGGGAGRGACGGGWNDDWNPCCGGDACRGGDGGEIIDIGFIMLIGLK